MDRRKFLKIAGMASVLPLFPETAFASAKAPLEKTLSFYNTHTGEQLKTTYWADGAYIPEAMSDINHILRDYRNGQSVQMDIELFDLLYAIRSRMESREPFQII